MIKVAVKFSAEKMGYSINNNSIIQLVNHLAKVKLDSFLISYKKINSRQKINSKLKNEIINVLEENMGEHFYKSRADVTLLSKKQNLEDINKPPDIFKTYK